MEDSLDSTYSFVNIEHPGTDEFEYHLDESITLKETGDLSIVQSATESKQTNDVSETFANVNHWLLVELKSEQTKNRQLVENYNKLKSDFEDLKTSISVDKLPSDVEIEPKTLTFVTEVDKNGSLTNSRVGENNTSERSSMKSIKEEHLVELTNYLQSELTVCKKEMYAMNSRMVDLMKSLKEKKKYLSDIETQTGLDLDTELEFSMVSSTVTKPDKEFSTIETQTDVEDEETKTFSLVPNAPEEEEIFRNEKDNSSDSLNTWYCSNFSSDRNENSMVNDDISSAHESEVVAGQQQQSVVSTNDEAPIVVTGEVAVAVVAGQESIVSMNDDEAPIVVTVDVNAIVVSSTETNGTTSSSAKMCPICNKSFFVDDKELERHVNEHLDGEEHKCPMCSLKFDGVAQNYFELHVQSHFGQQIGDSITPGGTFYAHSLFE